LVVALPLADRHESRAVVEATRRRVVGIDFEKHGRDADAGEPAQMQVEKLAREPLPAPSRIDGDGQDFRLVGGATREDEAGDPVAELNAMRDHRRVDQELLHLAFAPAAPERLRMQHAEDRGIRRTRFGNHRLTASEPAREDPTHRRGRRAESCGLASGVRR
jgi:hypothetical protein